MTQNKAAILFLRLGLAFVFAYAGIAILLAPENLIGYLPLFIKNTLGARTELFLYLHAAFEIILAAWLLWGRWLKWAALVAFLGFTAITIFNFSLLDIVFRDVGLALAALSLYFLEKE